MALDKNYLSVKRMQSFTSVAPGEVTACVGCHENRGQTVPNLGDASRVMAMRRAPSKITPLPGVPDVPDFNRDVQPVLNKYCVRCHNTKDRNVWFRVCHSMIWNREDHGSSHDCPLLGSPCP